jgi:hypothetical protein
VNRLACAALAAIAVTVATAPVAAGKTPDPVPSLEPKATQKLWQQLVHRRHPLRAAAGCRPLRAVFYTSSDWLRVATKLAANASPCAQYYISIPPLAADKTAFRTDQARKIRALGPSFHTLAEVNFTGWKSWVAGGHSWHDAGVEARRRMAAAGFDVAAGDTWIVNELSSAVRANVGTARQDVRDLVRGLYEGDGALPQARGAVFIIGVGQPTPDLTTYKANLQSWYVDASFWQDMSAYVSDWSQEVYGDIRNHAVPGASPASRAEHLNDFLGHQLTFADAAPAEAQTAKSFLRNAYSPLANAAWAWDSAFGFTNVPLDQMQDYVTTQTYALRVFGLAKGLPTDHFGFAWAPRMPDGGPWTADYTTQSAQLLDRLAAAIHDSDQAPETACGASWCTASIAGASFVETWKTFASWAQSTLVFATPSATIVAGTPSPPLTVQLQAGGTAQNTGVPLTVTLTTSSTAGTFSVSPDGPWTPTLDVTIPGGGSSASFYYRDTTAGVPRITATTSGRLPAVQQESVVAAPLVSLQVVPATATIRVGGRQALQATGVDAYGNRTAATATWTASRGTVSPVSGSSTTFTATDAGAATVTATAAALTASAAVSVTPSRLRVAAIASARRGGRLRVSVTIVDASGRGVSGASVALRVSRSSRLLAAVVRRTGRGGRLVVVTAAAPRGCYSAAVTRVTARGYASSSARTSKRACFRT